MNGEYEVPTDADVANLGPVRSGVASPQRAQKRARGSVPGNPSSDAGRIPRVQATLTPVEANIQRVLGRRNAVHSFEDTEEVVLGEVGFEGHLTQ